MDNNLNIACLQLGETNEHFEKRKEDAQKFYALWTRLNNEKNMMGYLCTVHKNKVEINNPEVRKEIQEQLDKAVNTISLAYVWALLDEGGFDSQESDWLRNCEWLTDAELLELQAWKHVRNTGAHAPSGRAKGFRREFDEFMNGSEQELSGLKKNCTFSADSIELGDGMSYRFFEFAERLVTKALGNSANNNPQ